MSSINMLKERRLSAKMDSELNESDYERRKQFNYFADASENNNADLYIEDEDLFYEPQAEKKWQCKFCAILLPSLMSFDSSLVG